MPFKDIYGVGQVWEEDTWEEEYDPCDKYEDEDEDE